MSVAEEWQTRLPKIKEPAQDWSDHAHKFFSAWENELQKQLSRPQSLGARYSLAKAIEEAVAAMVSSVTDNSFKRDDKPYSATLPDVGITKTADLSFSIDGDSAQRTRLVFEIKTALEFNTLAAAYAESLAIRTASFHERIFFMLFSVAGKGGYTSEKAKKVIGHLNGKNSRSSIDDVIVLSIEAGRPGDKNEDAIKKEILESLSTFEKALTSLVAEGCHATASLHSNA